MNESVTYYDDQLSELEEAFLLFDNLGDCKIAFSQVGDVLRSLGHNPRESDIMKFKNLSSPDERLSLDTFLAIYHSISKSKITDTTDDFVDCLRHFDKDGNGFLSSAELRHILTTLGEKLTDEEVEDLLTGHKDSQGNVNYEEFVNLVMSL